MAVGSRAERVGTVVVGAGALWAASWFYLRWRIARAIRQTWGAGLAVPFGEVRQHGPAPAPRRRKVARLRGLSWPQLVAYCTAILHLRPAPAVDARAAASDAKTLERIDRVWTPNFCERCGEPILVLDADRHRFCSRECYVAWMRERNPT